MTAKSKLLVVYPRSGHETYESGTFVLGSVTPGLLVKINGEPVPTSASGSFVKTVALQPGANTVTVQAFDQGGRRKAGEQILTITQPPPVALPVADGEISPEGQEPGQSVILRAGDTLRLACVAKPDLTVRATIPGIVLEPAPLYAEPSMRLADNREAIFAELHQTDRAIPAQGHYLGQIRIPATAPSAEKRPILLHLDDGQGEPESVTMRGDVTIWHQDRPAEVTTDRAVLRTAPATGARYTPQRAGTRLLLTGAVGDWYRVDLGPCRSGWMTAADVSLQAPKPTVLIPVPLIKTQATAENRTLIRVPLREPVPVLIESDQDRLNISLVNTVSQCDFIQYDPADRLIREIVWRQETDRVVTLRATVSGLSGYDYGYENGELVISVKTLPQSVSATRILLDPGHGGAETGGTDPTGIPEKTLNLSLALQVEDALKQAGFQVILTRRDDRDVSLQERQRLALEHQADIILSLHHNALPDGRRPEDIKGICTFYYHPFALPLAKQLQHGLVNGLNRPDYGVFYDSLYLTRIHQALSLLLEFGFMTHPEEADILRDPAFQRQVAQTLCESLLRFLKP